MIRVEFDTDNAAFKGEDLADEGARILRHAADKIEEGHLDGPLVDFNGNRVGRFEVLPSQRLS